MYSTGNFYRIRSAIGLGAERLMRLFTCTEDKITAEFDYFFKNTWDRHGNGHWMDLHSYNQHLRNTNAQSSTYHESEFETIDVSSETLSTWCSEMKRALIGKGKGPMYLSNEVHAMYQLPSQDCQVSIDEAMRMQHKDCDLMYLTQAFKNQSFHGYLQPPFNVMDSSKLLFPSPPPPLGFIQTPPPGFSQPPPPGSSPPLPGFTPELAPLPGFTLAPPPPGFNPAPQSPLPSLTPALATLPGFTPAPPPPGFNPAPPSPLPGFTPAPPPPGFNPAPPSPLPGFTPAPPPPGFNPAPPSPLPGFTPAPPPPGFSPAPLPGFTPAPPPPGFEHPQSPAVPPVNVTSWSNNMPYSGQVNSSEVFWSEQDIYGDSSSYNSSFRNSSGTSYMPRGYWDTTELKKLARENDSDDSLPPNSTKGIVTSNVKDNQLANHMKWPMVVPNSSRFSPGSSQKGVDNSWLSSSAFGSNADLINLSSAQKSIPPKSLYMTNYSSPGATSDPCVVRLFPDILKADFLNHWHNLEHARHCENPQLQRHFPYLLSPPFYYPPLPAYSPWDNAPMKDIPHIPPPPLLLSVLSNQFLHHGFNPSLNNRDVDLASGHGSSGGIGTFLLDPASYQNRYYVRKNHSITKYEEEKNRCKKNWNKKGYHHNFYSDERYNRSVHSKNFNHHTKQNHRRFNNEAAFHSSTFDNKLDVTVPDNNEDPLVLSDVTNEASNQGESSQNVSNEIENVEGDSADPSPYQPPESDPPETQDEDVSMAQDEDVSMFNNADFPPLC
ncbi:hypothetical protein Lal_00020417 [Lupinus albus]|nr:hypothetical protein Lal_00020417 [Lupinus albus]